MGCLDPRHKTKSHVLALALIVGAVGITAYRMTQSTMIMTRADTMALGMGAKSLLIIGYQMLSEHVRVFHRIASHRANLILNSLEVVFWAAVAGMMVQTNMNMCTGTLTTSCLLAWIVAGLGAVISILSLAAAVMSYRDVRWSKARRDQRKFDKIPENVELDTQPLRPVAAKPEGRVQVRSYPVPERSAQPYWPEEQHRWQPRVRRQHYLHPGTEWRPGSRESPSS